MSIQLIMVAQNIIELFWPTKNLDVVDRNGIDLHACDVAYAIVTITGDIVCGTDGFI